MGYVGIIGEENRPGRMHFGYFTAPAQRPRLYFSIRLFGKWYRKAI